VLDKKVASAAGKSGLTFRPEIRIRYELNGRKYEVWTYDAVNMFSPGKAAKQAIIDRFQVGATYPCWYDPDRPDQGVLVRGYTWSLSYVLLLGSVAVLVLGGCALYSSWKNRGKTAEQIAVEQAGGAALRLDPDRPTVPMLDLSQSPGSTLAYRLPMPGGSLLGCLFFTLVWNAITAPLVLASYLGWDGMEGIEKWILTIAAILFVLIGLLLILLLIYIAVRDSLVGPTTVEVSDHPLVPGGRCEVFLSQSGRLTLKMNSLRVLCICEEEAKRTDRGNTSSETRRVFEEEIIVREGFEVQPGLPFEVRGELRIPPGAMHSFVTVHNQVRWKVAVRGDVARWPDVDCEYPIVVLPSPEVAK
jgi:hypothetical protein